jgi:hypothetical protein
MPRLCLVALALAATLVGSLAPSVANAQSKKSAVYYPDATWQRKAPAEAGINAQQLKLAIDHAVLSETTNPRDLKLNHYRSFGREPFGDAIGPIKDRGDQTGIIVHKGAAVKQK